MSPSRSRSLRRSESLSPPPSAVMRRASTRVSLSPSSSVCGQTVKSCASRAWTLRHTSDVERAVRVDPRNLSWIPLAPAAISCLYSSSDTHATAGRATTPGPAPAAPALLADQARLDPRLAFPVVIGNVLCCDRPGVVKCLGGIFDAGVLHRCHRAGPGRSCPDNTSPGLCISPRLRRPPVISLMNRDRSRCLRRQAP